MDEYICPSIDDQLSESAITEEELEHNFRRFRNVLSPDLKAIGHMNNNESHQPPMEEKSPDQQVPSMSGSNTADTRRRVFSSSSKPETIDDDELFGHGQPCFENTTRLSSSSLPDIVASSPEVTPSNSCTSPDVVGVFSWKTDDKRHQMKESFEGRSFHPSRNPVQRTVSFDKNVKADKERSLSSSTMDKRRDYSSGYATGESDEKDSKAGSVKSQLSNTSVFNESCDDQTVPINKETNEEKEQTPSDSDSTICSMRSSSDDKSWELSSNQKSNAVSNPESNLTDQPPNTTRADLLPNLSLLEKEPERPFLSIFDSNKPALSASGNHEYFHNTLSDGDGKSVLLSDNCLSRTTDENSSKQNSIINKEDDSYKFVETYYLKKDSPEQSPHLNLIERHQELLEEKLMTNSTGAVSKLTKVPLIKRPPKASVSYHSLAAQSCLEMIKDRLVAEKRSESDSFSEVNRLYYLLTSIQGPKSSSSTHGSDEENASPGRSGSSNESNSETNAWGKSPFKLERQSSLKSCQTRYNRINAEFPTDNHVATELYNADHLQKIKKFLEDASRCDFSHCRNKVCLKGKQQIKILEQSLREKGLFSKDVNDIIWSLRFHAGECEEFVGKCTVPWCSFFQRGKEFLWARETYFRQNPKHTQLNEDLFLLMKERLKMPLMKFIDLGESHNFEMFEDSISTHQSLQIMPLCYLGNQEKTVLSQCGRFGYIVIQRTPRNYFDECIDGDFQLTHVLKKIGSQNHANIVRILWYSLHEEDLFICTAFCSNAGFLYRKKMKWKDVLIIMRHILSAVLFLNENNIVYLNWEAKNILCGESINSVKLSNFKAAVSLDESDNIDYGALRFIIQPYIIPPELTDSRPRLCHKTDTYGIGCLMHELLHGKHVWWKLRHMDRSSLSKKIAGESPTISEDLPSSQKMVLDHCWKINPEERPSLNELRTLIMASR